MRRNEFLMATANPIDSQITGVEGRAYLLREAARGLQMDTNKIVPDQNTFEQQKIQAAAQVMAQQMVQQMLQQMQQPQAPQGALPAPQEQLPDGAPAGGQMANTVQPMRMADGGSVPEPMTNQVVRSLIMNGSI